MDSTLGASSSSDPADADPRWVLTLACSPRPTAVGMEVALPPGSAVELGRHFADFGPDALADHRISRAHARIRVAPDGACTIEDRGSHNGTRVNGTRVSLAALARHDVVGLGNVLVHVDRDTAAVPPGGSGERLRRELAQVATHANAVLVTGATGTGKDWCANQLHHLRASPGALVVIDCATLPEDAVDRTLLGDRDQPGLLAEAQGGTLYLDAIDRAPARLQALVLGVLKHRRFQAGHHTRPQPFDAFVVASASDGVAASPGIEPALAARLGAWTLRLGPLAARRREIPALAAAIVRQQTGRDLALHARLVLELLHADYPGNLHDLRAKVTRAVREAGGQEPVPPPAPQADADPAAVSIPGPQLQVDARGRWFTLDHEARTPLTHRPVLMRLLAALVAAHVRAPGSVSTPVQLVAAGWGDERLAPRVGINRLYVGVSTLRKLGLHDTLERTKSGYRFASGTRVVVVDDDASMA